jgi:hypothetical protein
VTRYFVSVAASDNTSEAQSRIRAHYRSFYATAPPGYADALATSLPVREANGTLQTLQRARAVLAAAVADGRAPNRPPLPSRVPVAACDGYMCNAEGSPIFGAGFNVWADGGAPPFDPIASGITVTTVGFSAAYLLPNLTWPAPLLARAATTLRYAAAANMTVHVLMGQAMPAWAEAKWPGLNSGNFTEHGCSYDIDNPGGAVVTGQAIAAFLDAHGCHPAIGGWILANEPDFPQSATQFTIAKYRAWLEQEYGTIASLNAAWTAHFTSFDNIASQPIAPTWQQAVVSGGAAAEWWDWNQFNNIRVTQFFGRIASQLHNWTGGPTTLKCLGTTIKLQVSAMILFCFRACSLLLPAVLLCL